jgi:hypothetical protein
VHGKEDLKPGNVFHSAGVISMERYVFAAKSKSPAPFQDYQYQLTDSPRRSCVPTAQQPSAQPLSRLTRVNRADQNLADRLRPPPRRLLPPLPHWHPPVARHRRLRPNHPSPARNHPLRHASTPPLRSPLLLLGRPATLPNHPLHPALPAARLPPNLPPIHPPRRSPPDPIPLHPLPLDRLPLHHPGLVGG